MKDLYRARGCQSCGGLREQEGDHPEKMEQL